jgi:hypothetical protein
MMGSMARFGRRDVVAGVPATLAPAEPALAVGREPRTELLTDTGEFPNSKYPALIYPAVLAKGGDLAASLGFGGE